MHKRTRKFLISSHGTMASGVKSSLDIIIGDMENIFLVEAYVTENKPIEEEVNDILKSVNADDELIIFTDLLGGSVTNQMARFALQENIHLISGFNLPLVIEILLADVETPIAGIIETAISNAREQIVYVNRLTNSSRDNSADD